MDESSFSVLGTVSLTRPYAKCFYSLLGLYPSSGAGVGTGDGICWQALSHSAVAGGDLSPFGQGLLCSSCRTGT